jgi:hypothetical protein
MSKLSSGQRVARKPHFGYFNPDETKRYALGKRM